MKNVNLMVKASLAILLLSFHLLNGEHMLVDSLQMVTVVTPSWDSVQGNLQRYERKNHELWQPIGEEIPVVVGKTGLAWGIGLHRHSMSEGPSKLEGDGKSPAGMFALGPAFGFASQEQMNSLKLDYLPLHDQIEAVDDPKSIYYNQIINKNDILIPDWHSSEQMGLQPLYILGLVIHHNFPNPQKGRGSAIFFHLWRNAVSGTAGCTAMSHENLSEILSWLDKEKNPIFVQLPSQIYLQNQKEWDLP